VHRKIVRMRKPTVVADVENISSLFPDNNTISDQIEVVRRFPRPLPGDDQTLKEFEEELKKQQRSMPEAIWQKKKPMRKLYTKIEPKLSNELDDMKIVEEAVEEENEKRRIRNKELDDEFKDISKLKKDNKEEFEEAMNEFSKRKVDKKPIALVVPILNELYGENELLDKMNNEKADEIIKQSEKKTFDEFNFDSGTLFTTDRTSTTERL
jgi:uncharacterized protein YbcC (UPF0753/DUF2309 family)